MADATAPLISGLLQPQAYPHPAPRPQLIETHISWLILAGTHAYKLKKPLNLGFLDFSSLEARHYYCQEEVRLNRRLATDIYLGVVAITGTVESPKIGGSGPVLEWAVHMHAFDPHACLDQAPPLDASQVVDIAVRLAEFHASLPPLTGEAGGEQTLRSALDNFSQLRACRGKAGPLDVRLDGLEDWTRQRGESLQRFFANRQQQGHVRECHGDLHLGNIAWHNGRALIFDALEFNPQLRCIDTINECAFLMMDLLHHGQTRQAWRFINEYLERSGDYAALSGLSFYLSYRAMVRAKVAAIRCTQDGGDAAEVEACIELANRLTQNNGPALILMHGLSGSGKSRLASELMELLGAIRLRSDVERKRLFGLRPEQSSLAIDGGIYTREAGQRTRQRLLDLSRDLLVEGFVVIIDATFIRRDWRTPFAELARQLNVPWCIVSLQVEEPELRRRLRRRMEQGCDASEADESVLDAQLANHEPLTPAERERRIRVTATDEAGTLAPIICESLSLKALP